MSASLPAPLTPTLLDSHDRLTASSPLIRDALHALFASLATSLQTTVQKARDPAATGPITEDELILTSFHTNPYAQVQYMRAMRRDKFLYDAITINSRPLPPASEHNTGAYPCPPLVSSTLSS